MGLTAEAGIKRRINPNKVLTQSERSYRSREKHREKINAKQKAVRQTERGRYYRNKGHWVAEGVVEPEEGWETFYYDKFLTTTQCESCGIDFGTDGTKSDGKCLDHCHLSGHIRNIICRRCNYKRNIPDNLRMKLMLEIHRYHLTC